MYSQKVNQKKPQNKTMLYHHYLFTTDQLAKQILHKYPSIKNLQKIWLMDYLKILFQNTQLPAHKQDKSSYLFVQDLKILFFQPSGQKRKVTDLSFKQLNRSPKSISRRLDSLKFIYLSHQRNYEILARLQSHGAQGYMSFPQGTDNPLVFTLSQPKLEGLKKKLKKQQQNEPLQLLMQEQDHEEFHHQRQHISSSYSNKGYYGSPPRDIVEYSQSDEQQQLFQQPRSKNQMFWTQ